MVPRVPLDTGKQRVDGLGRTLEVLHEVSFIVKQYPGDTQLEIFFPRCVQKLVKLILSQLAYGAADVDDHPQRL